MAFVEATGSPGKRVLASIGDDQGKEQIQRGLLSLSGIAIQRHNACAAQFFRLLQLRAMGLVVTVLVPILQTGAEQSVLHSPVFTGTAGRPDIRG